MRPLVVCYCDLLPRLRPRTRVVILQHPRERLHPLNTAGIVERGIEGSQLISAGPAGLGAAISNAKLPRDAALLYPSANAELLEELPPSQLPECVIVVDGTWHHAKTLLRDVPELRHFRRVRFRPQRPSNYRIRREPRADYLSTVESVHHVLSRIEPDLADLDSLLSCFDAMVDRNLAARRPNEAGERFRSRSQSRPHRFPLQLDEEEEDLMIVYAEGTSRFARVSTQRDEQAPRKKEPLVVAVGRPGDETPHLWWCRTQAQVPSRLLSHLGSNPSELREVAQAPGVVREEVIRRIRDARAVVAWNASTFRILEELGVSLPAPLQLKATYCDHRLYLASRGQGTLPERWGEMDDVIRRHGLQPNPSTTAASTDRDRAVVRWRQTKCLLSWLQGLRDQLTVEELHRQ